MLSVTMAERNLLVITPANIYIYYNIRNDLREKVMDIILFFIVLYKSYFLPLRPLTLQENAGLWMRLASLFCNPDFSKHGN